MANPPDDIDKTVHDARMRETVDESDLLSLDITLDSLDSSDLLLLPAELTDTSEDLGDLSRGQTIGRYLVVDRLGAGGMGVVYRAYDPELDRRVALKVIHPAPNTELTQGTEQARGRLLKEAQALAQISHPNVIPVFDIGTIGRSEIFVAMEYVEGHDLKQWLDSSTPHTWREILTLFLAAGEGLVAAHNVGLVHRDFKPENVLLGSDGRIRVIDFGLARRTEAPRERTQIELDSAVLPVVSQAGMIVGTPIYMAPEQFNSDEVTDKTDQFNYCASLFEALYSTLPHGGETITSIAFNVTTGHRQAPPLDTLVPKWLHVAMERGLSTSTEDRWPSMRALLDVLAVDPIAVRRRRMAVGATLLLVCLAIAGAWWWGTERESQTAVPLPCQGLDEPMLARWNDVEREALRRSITATEHPFAQDILTHVESGLDSYADAWVLARMDACESTAVQKTQSEALLERRMACLDQRLHSIDAVLGLLKEADKGLANQARKLVGGLPSIDTCSDRAALMAGWAEPPDPSIAADVEQLEARIERIRALREAGRYKEGLTTSQALTVEARTVGYAPTLARALFFEGKLLMHRGKAQEAAEALFESARVATAARDDHATAEAWIALIFVYSNGLDEFDAAERWFKHAKAALERRGYDGRLYGEMMYSASGLAVKQGHYALAVERTQAGITAFSEALGPNHYLNGLAYSGLGRAYGKLAQNKESIQAHAKALEIIEQSLGSHHPNVGLFLSNLGAAYSRNYQYDKSYEYQVRALEHKRTHLGSENKSVAISMGNVAIAEMRRGHFEEAITLLNEALLIKEKVLPEGHTSIGYTLSAQGQVYLHWERFSDAIAPFERALALYERKYKTREHANVASTLAFLCELELELDHFDRARVLCEEALTIQRIKLPTDHPEIAYTLLLVGTLHRMEGRMSEARTSFEAALEIFAKLSPDPLIRGRILLQLALVEHHTNPSAKPQALLMNALKDFEKVPSISKRFQSQAHALLAQINPG